MVFDHCEQRHSDQCGKVTAVVIIIFILFLDFDAFVLLEWTYAFVTVTEGMIHPWLIFVKLE